jgi:protease-4
MLQELLGSSSSLIALISEESKSYNVELADNSVSSQPLSNIVKMMKAELSQINQFNDPQGKYALCVACMAN